MNIDDLQKRFWVLARALPPDDRVPYAFEQRIMAAVRGQPGVDLWSLWSRLLWRAAAPCVGLMLLVSVWSLASGATSASATLASDLEFTVWGPLTSLNESW